MKIKVNPKSMNNSSKNLKQLYEKLNKEIYELEQLVETTDEVYEGADADSLKKSMRNYINFANKMLRDIDKLYVILTNTLKRYGYCDEKFSNRIRQVEGNMKNGN